MSERSLQDELTYRFEDWCHARLPRTPWADNVAALVQFYNRHHRLPRARRGSMNDAVHWLRVSGQLREPERVETTDKELAKNFVRHIVGDTYPVPTLAVLRDAASAAAFSYPDQCVIKPTHMSGHIIFRQHGEPVNLDRIRGWFSANYYDQWREQLYRDLTPKVIVEPLLPVRMADVRIFCVHGEPRAIEIGCTKREGSPLQWYSAQWERLPFTIRQYALPPAEHAPANLSELHALAIRLSRPFNLVRVDFYTDGREIAVGEITHCHGAAQTRFYPPSGEWLLGNLLFGPEGFDRANFTGRREARRQEA